jgi:hypothetical protein
MFSSIFPYVYVDGLIFLRCSGSAFFNFPGQNLLRTPVFLRFVVESFNNPLPANGLIQGDYLSPLIFENATFRNTPLVHQTFIDQIYIEATSFLTDVGVYLEG